jgi:hypothetical protein
MDIGHVLIVIFKHVLAVWNTVRTQIGPDINYVSVKTKFDHEILTYDI